MNPVAIHHVGTRFWACTLSHFFSFDRLRQNQLEDSSWGIIVGWTGSFGRRGVVILGSKVSCGPRGAVAAASILRFVPCLRLLDSCFYYFCNFLACENTFTAVDCANVALPEVATAGQLLVLDETESVFCLYFVFALLA